MVQNWLQELGLWPVRNWLHGEWVDGEQFADVRSPYDGRVLAAVPQWGAVAVRSALTHAERVQRAWAALPWLERAHRLKRWAERIEQQAEPLAMLMVAESGKTLKDARAEVVYAASFLHYYANPALEPKPVILDMPGSDVRRVVWRRPLGVVAAITPWNFPAAMVTRKLAPALVAGCSVLLKPAEETPLTALALGKLAEQAGIDKGVLQIMTGEPEAIGRAICESHVVRGIGFTGSTDVGRWLMRHGAEHIQRLGLELGGNAPFLILPDAPLEQALDGLMHAKFRNAGQTCISPNRILLHAEIAEAFLSRLTERLRMLRLGYPMDVATDIGPLIHRAAADRVRARVEEAVAQGAALWLPDVHSDLPEGNRVPPILLTRVTPEMRVWHEENFGPVIAVRQYADIEMMLREANDTEAGLAAYVYGGDVSQCHRLAARLEYGMVGINSVKLSTAVAPFGGMKASGLGREGGAWGLEEYLEWQAWAEE